MVAIPGLQGKGDRAAQRPWSAERKLGLVLEGICGRHPVSELCSQANISRACYYHWRHQFIDAGQRGLAHSEADCHTLEEHIRQLEAENANLRAHVRLLQDLCTMD
jgi:transposase-like protein